MRIKKAMLLGMILLLVVLLGACAAPAPTPTPVPTPTPTPAPMPTPAPAPVLPPPTKPVPVPGALTTQGYVYDDKLGYGFEYPGGWKMEIPEVIDGEDTESVVMFTKPGTPTTLIVTVKLSNLTSLEEVKEEFREGLKGLGGTILEEREIVVNGKEGYEVIYKPIAAVKIRQVIFIANGKMACPPKIGPLKSYMLICSTAELLYDEYEETFNNVINSFVIE